MPFLLGGYMKIAICDDSLKDAKYLQELCLSIDILLDTTINVYTSANKLLQLYETGTANYDLLFLDVEMLEMDGITLGKKIKALSKDTIIVFTTSYPQFAIDAFECEALNYILKPCGKEKVESVLNKAITKYTLAHQYHIAKCRNQTYRIPINDIYYIECCRKHIIYHLKDRTIETVSKLSSVYEALCDFGFYQVHQGYIVNFDKVYDFKDYTVVLDDYRTVMVSVRKKREVLLAYAKYAERYI